MVKDYNLAQVMAAKVFDNSPFYALSENELKIIRNMLYWEDHNSKGWQEKKEILGKKHNGELLPRYKSQAQNFRNNINRLMKMGIIEHKTFPKKDKYNRDVELHYYRLVQNSKGLSLLSLGFEYASFLTNVNRQNLKGFKKQVTTDTLVNEWLESDYFKSIPESTKIEAREMVKQFRLRLSLAFFENMLIPELKKEQEESRRIILSMKE